MDATGSVVDKLKCGNRIGKVQTTSGVNNSPTLIKREISTSVGALDGDVILLGGLDDSKNSGDSSGLSFLPRFTRSQGSESSNSQIVLVLQVKKI